MKNLAILLFFGYIAMAYAAGLLQNEDFSTQAELEARGGSKANLLNDTKVYVTADGLNKRLDEAIIDGDIGAGGGGSAGINFITDASFEKETFAPTVSVAGGTATYPTYTANDKLYSEFNTKYYQVTHTGLSAANYSVNYSQARTDLDGKQGLFSIWAKVDAELDLCIELDASGTCESTVSLIADNTWRKYEIPFVFGASSVEFNFFNASLTGNITLQLDKVYIGTMPDGYIQDVGQASFVGDINFNSTGCVWTISAGTGFQSFPVDSDCSYIARGNVLAPDTKIPAVKITNARTDGYYKVVLNGLFGVTQGSVSDVCSFNLSDSSNQNDNGGFAFTQTTPGTTFDSNRFANEITGQFKFTTSGDKTIQVLGRPNTSGDSCSIFADAAIYGGTISVHFFPDNNSTIVAQPSNSREIILNAQANANQSISDQTITVATNWSVTKDTANIFDPSTGTITIPEDGYYSGTLFYRFDTESPDKDYLYCVAYFTKGASSPGSAWRTSESGSVTSPGTQTRVSCNVNIEAEYLQAGDKIYTAVFQDNGDGDANNLSSGSNSQFLSFYKVETSRTIIGKFENINSSDLISIAQTDVTAQSVNDATDTEIDGISYTITKASRYYIDAVSTLQTNATGYFRVDITKNTSVVSNYFVCNKENTNWISCRNNYIGNFEVGDVVKISVVQGTGGARNVNLSKLTIQELPDTESIIKNLSQEKTTCMTKYLSGDISSTGNIASWNFSNLQIGKRYRAYGKLQVQSSVTQDITLDTYLVHNSSDKMRFLMQEIYSANARMDYTFPITDFTASGTTLDFNVRTLTANVSILASIIPLGSYLRLCELPSTYVETTEW